MLLLVLDIESINEYEYDDENEEEGQPLLTPDTIDIVLFIELNWAKIYHTTFAIYMWDMTLVFRRKISRNSKTSG